MIYIFMGILMRLLWATWSLHVFFSPYLVKILVEVLHSLLGWKNTWMIILMHIIYFWSSIMGHGILTYVMGKIWYNTLCLCVWATGWSTHLDVPALSWFFDHVHFYDVVTYFHDLYFVLMMFGRVQYQQWNPRIGLFISLGVGVRLLV